MVCQEVFYNSLCINHQFIYWNIFLSFSFITSKMSCKKFSLREKKKKKKKSTRRGWTTWSSWKFFWKGRKRNILPTDRILLKELQKVVNIPNDKSETVMRTSLPLTLGIGGRGRDYNCYKLNSKNWWPFSICINRDLYSELLTTRNYERNKIV